MEPKWTDWRGCYDEGWGPELVPAAFAHPAKMAKSLLIRIVQRFLDEGWIKPGEVVGDPFGGIGSTGIIASYHGLRSFSVELEPRFHALAMDNFRMHAPRWRVSGDPSPVMIQGDSRLFAELVGSLDGIVSSPPYAGISPEGSSTSIDLGKQYETYRSSGGGASFEKFCITQQKRQSGYGSASGQIGTLPSGNLDAVVTSPPFSEPGCQPIGSCPSGTPVRSKRKDAGLEETEYGHTPGQIGNDTGETYWTACAEVYRQLHLALKPGAVAALVVKDYCKAGKIVPLCDQTCQLLESLGFEVFERTRAWLVKREEHPSLFDDGPVVKTTSRKSFFRRLHEKKRPDLAIDFEQVIWARKAAA